MDHISVTVKNLRDRISRLRSQLDIQETEITDTSNFEVKFREVPQVVAQTVVPQEEAAPQKVSKEDLRAKLSGVKKSG
jgi:hypothetical protein